MTDIHIPPEALEAGAMAACAKAGYDWTVTPDVHAHWREQAHDCCLAMLKAWPGMHQFAFSDNRGIFPALILPLPLPPAGEKE